MEIISDNSFHYIINDYLKLWPSKINVSGDFVLRKPSPFKELISLHDEIEGYLSTIDNDEMWVLDWSFFKYLKQLAKEEGRNKIIINEVDLELVEQIYKIDIQQWREDFGKK